MSEFYRELPKAELHVHLEGSVEPETALELDPALALADVEAQCAFSDFPGFIKSYVWVNRLLRQPSDYRIVTRRLIDRLRRENVLYAEINLSVGVILWKHQDVRRIFSEVAEEASDSPVKVRWIFDAVRQFGAEAGFEVAKLAVEYLEQGVVGFGIGGDEAGGPVTWFENVFQFATSSGLAVVPHAGETVGPESIWAAVRLGARRIGHGITAIDDPDLLKLLREMDIPLEISITSNVCTGVVRSLEEHPVRRLFDAGVPITLNTDDPALFRCTLAGEYQLAAERFGFSESELTQIAENSFRYALDWQS